MNDEKLVEMIIERDTLQNRIRLLNEELESQFKVRKPDFKKDVKLLVSLPETIYEKLKIQLLDRDKI